MALGGSVSPAGIVVVWWSTKCSRLLWWTQMHVIKMKKMKYNKIQYNTMQCKTLLHKYWLAELRTLLLWVVGTNPNLVLGFTLSNRLMSEDYHLKWNLG